MKRTCLVLIFSFMLLLTASVFAQHGDVTIKFNSSGVLPGEILSNSNNIMEVWARNDASLLGMSLGFRFTSTVSGFSWLNPYGNMPIGPNHWVQEEGDAVGAFDQGHLKFSHNIGGETLPDSFLIGGAATPAGDPSYGTPLPAHAVSTLCWTLTLIMPDAGPNTVCDTAINKFTVTDIFFPPAGSWKMDDGTNAYPPTFNQVDVGSSAQPTPEPITFCVHKIACLPPVFTTTPTPPVNKNHCTDYGFTFQATEGGNPTPADPVTYSTNVGTINATTGQLSVPHVTTCGTTDVIVTATNACQSTATFPFTINWTNNNPTITGCPAELQKVGKGNPYVLHLVGHDADPCDAVTFTVAQTGGPAPVGTFGISGTGDFTFSTANADAPNTFTFTATATDPCGGTATCTFQVEVLSTEPFGIKIEKDEGPTGVGEFGGHYANLSIIDSLGSESMGGFDFLIAYDASALTFAGATLGAGPTACGWEYFTYRFGVNGNCGGPCPSGMLRVIAIADQNDGPHHPTCYALSGTELVSLKFYVTNDGNYECMFVPVRFAWMDCGDNVISNIGGDTLWVEDHVFGYVNGVVWDGTLTGSDAGELYFPHFGGISGMGCLAGSGFPGKPFPIPFIDFYNGGIDIACNNDIDARGDLNLNGIANEIADAVLYTNYFLKGITAFPSLGREGAIAASDVNADGNRLTVGDLVYLLRIIVGDALPYPKLAPFANSATVNFVDGAVSTESGSEIGALLATFKVNGAYTVSSSTDMQVSQNSDNGELKVLVWSGTENMTNRIAAGSNNLFAVNGDVELTNVEVADYSGNMLNTRVNKTSLPKAFALQQNTPNPFNPTTKIGFALPTQSQWTLNIYNVAGQLVKSFNGNNVGNVSVEWDASTVSSGVYFYKLSTNSFSDTKKMVLMK